MGQVKTVVLPNFFAVLLGGAAAVVAFAATTLGVPKEKLWVAALVGAVVAGISFFVPAHEYTQAQPDPRDPKPEPVVTFVPAPARIIAPDPETETHTITLEEDKPV